MQAAPIVPEKLKAFVQAWIITMVGVLVAAHVVDGITYEGWVDLVVATLLLGLLNAFVRPILMLLSLPLLLLTLGLFTLVINAGLLWLVGELVKGFHVAGFWAAFKGALVIAVLSLLLNSLTGTGNTRVRFSRARRREDRSGSDDRGGPVIDV
ncbi:phage holin family protein [Fontisphaera persica]|uniref:phage holin family protein n=1 Tax=Fontisphaera persica TaxID=2974023 RepID=UPI0024BFB8BE|nr:phage holin family protein [Fontisphaera persica]WCJ58447.1 phage holin family protein [Fontisphaera persica]